jgi:hypothetical protein
MSVAVCPDAFSAERDRIAGVRVRDENTAGGGLEYVRIINDAILGKYIKVSSVYTKYPL